MHDDGGIGYAADSSYTLPAVPHGGHPEQSFSWPYREKRSRRICGLLASATIPNPDPSGFGLRASGFGLRASLRMTPRGSVGGNAYMWISLLTRSLHDKGHIGRVPYLFPIRPNRSAGHGDSVRPRRSRNIRSRANTISTAGCKRQQQSHQKNKQPNRYPLFSH